MTVNTNLKILNEEFEENRRFYYRDTFEENEIVTLTYERIEESLKNASVSSGNLLMFYGLQLSEYRFSYAVFILLKLENETLAKEHFSKAFEYGRIALQSGARSCTCFNPSPFIVMNNATFTLTNLVNTHQYQEADSVAKDLIDSLNGNGCIIKRGNPKMHLSWFVIELYSRFLNIPITLHKVFRPTDKDMEIYTNVLKIWDSVDNNEIDKHISFLCDLHLVQAHTDYAITQEDDYYEKEDPRSSQLYMSGMYLYPFEALMWLPLRERKGLPNPTEFSHPLMNTPLAKMFLELKTPLPKPKELPYAKELLTKLKEACPQIEVQI